MVEEVRWSKQAVESFEKILAYLQAKWTQKEIIRFVNSTNEIIHLIRKHPTVFRKSDKKNLREALITKHNLLIYRINAGYIELVNFWDTRQNPKRKFKKR